MFSTHLDATIVNQEQHHGNNSCSDVGENGAFAETDELDSSSTNVNQSVYVEDMPKGLITWREAIGRCATSAQLAMCLYMLESSIAWDKSIMKAVSFRSLNSKN